MSATDNNRDDDIPPNICANCGKGEESTNTLKACTACKMVKYCNRDCQIAHRPKHKKECRRRAAELHDIELFKHPPPLYEDCPICFLRMPYLGTGKRYHACCGKTICSGCVYAPVYDHEGNKVPTKTCPFCRTPALASGEESIEKLNKRMEAGDAIATYNLGVYYRDGLHGFPQDYDKAFELWHRAGELGYATAYCNLGFSYVRDEKKAIYYWELAAMRGDAQARHNLGIDEAEAGKVDRALKHYMIAVRCGYTDSLKRIKQLYTRGWATKDEYTKALQAYQEYLGEIKSDQRNEAGAFDRFKYY